MFPNCVLYSYISIYTALYFKINFKVTCRNMSYKRKCHTLNLIEREDEQISVMAVWATKVLYRDLGKLKHSVGEHLISNL